MSLTILSPHVVDLPGFGVPGAWGFDCKMSLGLATGRNGLDRRRGRIAHTPSSKLGVKRLPEATLISTRIFGGTLIGRDEQVHWRSDKQLKSS